MLDSPLDETILVTFLPLLQFLVADAWLRLVCLTLFRLRLRAHLVLPIPCRLNFAKLQNFITFSSIVFNRIGITDKDRCCRFRKFTLKKVDSETSDELHR